MLFINALSNRSQERIGLLTSMPLLNNIVSDLMSSQDGPLCSLYFTKVRVPLLHVKSKRLLLTLTLRPLQESHIHTLLNLVLASNLPVVMDHAPALDYFSSITFGELLCCMSQLRHVLMLRCGS